MQFEEESLQITVTRIVQIPRFYTVPITVLHHIVRHYDRAYSYGRTTGYTVLMYRGLELKGLLALAHKPL